jgi:hypothetical protein
VFAWYTRVGSVATATGALFAGAITGALQKTALAPVAAYRTVVFLYAGLGSCLSGFISPAFVRSGSAVLSRGVGLADNAEALFRYRAIPPRGRVVVKLSSLFALDSFAGGFVVQSFAAYWFYQRFGVHPETTRRYK